MQNKAHLFASLLFLGVFSDSVIGGKMRFPESAELEIDSADKVIDEILTVSRSGRDVQLRVGGKEVGAVSLASDAEFKELSQGKTGDVEARNYIANKLCSLGLARCGSDAQARHGSSLSDYGLGNIRDVTLVQPVALKPVGEPHLAIPLEKQPFTPVLNQQTHGKYMNSGFGSYPSEKQNYHYVPQQGGVISNSPSCTCVSIGQCNSYDVVNPVPAGSSSPGVIGGIGQPNYGNVGAGIDPRNKKTDIESNATVVDAVSIEPLARSSRSDISSNATEESRTKREAPFFNSNPRIINGALRGCYDDRLVCCRNPIKNPSSYPSGTSNYPSAYPSSSNYPSTSSNYPSSNYNPSSSNYPSTSSNYPSSNYNPSPSYPQTRPITNEYYPTTGAGGGSGVCGKRNSNGINGRVLSGSYTAGSAEFGEYPWQAALLKKDGTNSIFVCGASIIDNRHLLTAAHCIKSHRPEDLRIRLGEWDVNAENEFYPHVEFDVAAIALHPDYYAGNLINDLALIKLVGYVDFARYPHISPICLPPRGHDFTGSRCYATGWGKDAFGQGGKFQRILQEVDVPVINNYECEQRLRRTQLGPDFALHQGFLCAGGEPEKDACKGDGGGPLSCEIGGSWHLAGIVSWGVGCGSYGTPGVYVRTTSYLDWIRRTIQ